MMKARIPSLLHLVNESPDTFPPVAVLGMCNEFAPDEDGWLTVRFGDYPHDGKEGFDAKRDLVNNRTAPGVRRVVQRFTRANAEAFVRAFNSPWGRIKRAIRGKNIFLGHPDAPRFAKQFPDKAPRGAIADMEVTDEGWRIRPVLTEQGAADVEAGFREFSPHWGVRPVELTNDGTLIVEPVEFTSMGLVRRGNMPGLSLTNAAGAASTNTQENTTMPQWLIDLLIGAGIIKAGQSGEDTARTALTNHFSAHTAVVAERDTLKTQVDALTMEKTTLTNSVATEKTRADTAENALKEERKAHATALVNAAVADGRVPAAEKATKITALCNAADFAAEATALAGLKPALKTSSSLGNLGKVSNDATRRQHQVTTLVNAKIAEGLSYDDAFAAVQSEKPELFAAMKRSEATKAG